MSFLKITLQCIFLNEGRQYNWDFSYLAGNGTSTCKVLFLKDAINRESLLSKSKDFIYKKAERKLNNGVGD